MLYDRWSGLSGDDACLHADMKNVEKKSRGISVSEAPSKLSRLGELVFQKEWDFYPKDDLTGKPLGHELVTGAKREERMEMYRRQVWVERNIEDCIRDTGKPPIPVRWV